MKGTGTIQVAPASLRGGGLLLDQLSQGETASALAAVDQVEQAGAASCHGALDGGVSAFAAASAQGINALRNNLIGMSGALMASAWAYEATDSQGPFSGAQ